MKALLFRGEGKTMFHQKISSIVMFSKHVFLLSSKQKDA